MSEGAPRRYTNEMGKWLVLGWQPWSGTMFPGRAPTATLSAATRKCIALLHLRLAAKIERLSYQIHSLVCSSKNAATLVLGFWYESFKDEASLPMEAPIRIHVVPFGFFNFLVTAMSPIVGLFYWAEIHDLLCTNIMPAQYLKIKSKPFPIFKQGSSVVSYRFWSGRHGTDEVSSDITLQVLNPSQFSVD